jgi:hypothetical protein
MVGPFTVVVAIALFVLAVGAWPTISGSPAQSPSASGQTLESDVAVATDDTSSPLATLLSTAGSSSVPADVVVEPNIVERPGVPSSLRQLYWVEWGQVGELGTTARVEIPRDEQILGVDDGLVATMKFDPDTQTPVLGENGIAIVARDVRTGRTVKAFHSPVYITESVVVGSRLFWIGRMPPAGPGSTDAGLWVVDLMDPASAPRAIVEPSELSATYGPRATRGLLRVTDRGRAISTQIESAATLVTEVVDVEDLAVRVTIHADRMYAFQIAEGHAFAFLPHEYSGLGQTAGVRLLDIESGEQIGTTIEADLLKGSVLGSRELYVQIGRGVDSFIVAIDLESGKARDLRVVRGGTETFDLSSRLSSPDVLALVPVTGATLDPTGTVHLPVALLSHNGEFLPEAFAIGAP